MAVSTTNTVQLHRIVATQTSGHADPKEALQSFTNMIFSDRYQAIDFLRNEPSLSPLKEVIESLDVQNPYNFPYILGAINVLLGIKPALVIEPLKDLSEKKSRYELFEILQRIASLNPNCRFVPGLDLKYTSYFVNEAPLDQFDPRKYIQPKFFDQYHNSITEAILENYYCKKIPLTEWETVKNTQFSSYLLGYGPTWEAYVRPREYAPTVVGNPRKRIFSDQHYEELGKALGSDAAAGCEYSSFFSQTSQEGTDDELTTLSKRYLGMQFVTDETSLKTPYIKKLISLRYQFMQFLADFTMNPAFSPSEAVQQWIQMHAT